MTYKHSGFLKKAAAFVSSLAMVATSFTGLLVPVTAHAAANYVISGSLTENGLHVEADGVASANTYTGQGTAQYISISWDFIGNGSVWETLADHTTLNFLNNDKTSNGVITDTPWSASHTYSTAGTYTIKALIHHSQPSGNEAGAQVFEKTVEILPQCSDGIDNDDDGLIDFPEDPGCTSASDDSEDPNPAILGCTDAEANNYNPAATEDDGSCTYDPAPVLGCTDSTAFNYNPAATEDDGSCIPVVNGCTDSTAFNYNAEANTDDGSCVAVVLGCTDSTAFNYDETANTDDGSCIPVVNGCTVEGATNYNPEANTDDGSCTYPPNEVPGCTDESATNYNSEATTDDGSCEYAPEPVLGCTDSKATNYNSEATESDGSCKYKTSGGNTSGSRPTGSVLGASTGQVLGESCGLYMDQYLKRNNPKNNPAQVTKLQEFLTKNGFGSFTPTGFFGPLTEASVKAFQAKYTADILTPWNISAPTGLAYLTTIRHINLLECPDLVLPTPTLINWNQNPAVR